MRCDVGILKQSARLPASSARRPTANRKWVWAFIDAIANLVTVVVSIYSVRTGAGMTLC